MMKKTIFIFLILLFNNLFSQNHEANDCVNYIQICGNQTIRLNPAGYGIQEINYFNTCNGEEHNSLWLRFTVKTSGTLGFDLIPTNTDINVDYDFWIFGPNASCGKLGTSIRCSTTNPAMSGAADNHTGMRDSEPDGDFFEGPGDDGDNYIKSLNVVAGESYFIVIDRPIGDGAFSLNWTGTAILDDPFSTAPFSFIKPDDVKICKPSGIFDFETLTSGILNNNPDFKVYYYNTYEDANYDQNRITGLYTISSKKYYYRIQSTKTECFRVEEINVILRPLTLDYPEIKACNVDGSGTFDLTKAVFTTEKLSSIKFYHTSQEAEDHIPGTEITNITNYPSSGERLYVWVISDAGCEAMGSVDLVFYPVPSVDTTKYNSSICDDNFDNYINIRFSDITPVIVNNPSDFNIVYSLKSNPSVALPDEVRFNTTTTVIVEVKSKNGCPSAFGEIIFKIKPRLILNTVSPIPVCDNLLKGNIDINLADYKDLFTTNANVTYYASLQNAQNAKDAISPIQNIIANKTFYLRVENTIDCPEIGTLTLIFKQPKKSDTLRDRIICKGARIDLEAGAGFQSYLWDSGSTNSNSGFVEEEGEHWVDLEYNNCIYHQVVNVIAETEVIINYVEINDNTLIVHATGGSEPYQYSLDGVSWQLSNVFRNIPKGINIVYAKSSIDCISLPKEFLNINLINVITPNDDGINDVLNFSDLRIKNNVKLNIYDRNGKNVFTGSKDHYIWDGKQSGRSIPTGTYWYIIEYTEPDTGLFVTYKSWILVKHR